MYALINIVFSLLFVDSNQLQRHHDSMGVAIRRGDNFEVIALSPLAEFPTLGIVNGKIANYTAAGRHRLALQALRFTHTVHDVTSPIFHWFSGLTGGVHLFTNQS